MLTLDLGNIRVTYDGAWPNACRGRLKIFDGDECIYDKSYCCTSTGSVDDDSWHVENGVLEWDDAEDFSYDIQEVVRRCIEQVDVCCGGCI